MSHPDYKHIGDPAIRLIEELSELIKVICKEERFGWYNWHPDRPNLTNLDELRNEWVDVRDTYPKLINKILANKPVEPTMRNMPYHAHWYRNNKCTLCGRKRSG